MSVVRSNTARSTRGRGRSREPHGAEFPEGPGPCVIRLAGDTEDPGVWDMGAAPFIFDLTACAYLSTPAVAGLVAQARRVPVLLRLAPAGPVREKLARLLTAHLQRDPAGELAHPDLPGEAWRVDLTPKDDPCSS